MKTALKFLSVFLISLFVLSGCSNIPDEPLTSTVVECSYIDPVSETYPIPENAKDYPDSTYPVRYVEGPVNIECVVNSYYVDGNTVARFKSVKFTKEPGTSRTSGSLAMKVEDIGSRGNGLRIDYTCYDAEGNAISEDLSTRAELKGVKKGETVNLPLSLVDGTAKIVFTNYSSK